MHWQRRFSVYRHVCLDHESIDYGCRYIRETWNSWDSCWASEVSVVKYRGAEAKYDCSVLLEHGQTFKRPYPVVTCVQLAICNRREAKIIEQIQWSRVVHEPTKAMQGVVCLRKTRSWPWVIYRCSKQTDRTRFLSSPRGLAENPR